LIAVISGLWSRRIRSFALPSFWECDRNLPEEVRALADKQFRPFRENPLHPSLGFVRKGNVWTAEVGRSHRAMPRRRSDDVYWSWIGTHEAYNHLLARWR